MKKGILALAVGILVVLVPDLSVQFTIFLHHCCGIVSALSIYSLMAFMGPVGAIITDIMFCLVAGLLVATISARNEFLLVLLVGSIAPLIPESFSLIGVSIANYVLTVSYCVPSLLVGLLIERRLFKRFPA